jgi:hypothetical protein
MYGCRRLFLWGHFGDSQLWYEGETRGVRGVHAAFATGTNVMDVRVVSVGR